MTMLIQQWTGGDEDAAQQIFDRYSQRLIALAEKHLSHKLAGRVDGEDVVQSVFRSFFNRSADGKFRIDGSGDLWNLLVQITLNKTRMQARRHTAARRDVRAEAGGDDNGWLTQLVQSEPGPQEAVAFVDQIEALLSGLPPAYSEILTLRLEGHSRVEIARRLSISRQSVSRALRMMQDRLHGSLDLPADE